MFSFAPVILNFLERTLYHEKSIYTFEEFKEYATDIELPVGQWNAHISPYALKYYKQYS